MKVVTVINDTYDVYFNLLKTSCVLNGLELIVLVCDDKILDSRRIKDDLLYKYLSDDESLDSDELIFFTDGTDTLFTAGKDEIIAKYNLFGNKVVFSAEIACWPDLSLANKYPKNNNRTPYKYLNSGGFMGPVWLIRKLLGDIDYETDKFSFSNQYLWVQRYFNNNDKIVLDFNCEIFNTFYSEIGEEFLPNSHVEDFSKYYLIKKKWFNSNFELKGNRLKNNLTKTMPCHLHFNGTSKLLIDQDIYDMIFSSKKDYKPIQYYYDNEE